MFTTPDPLAEEYYHISPYAYCANNPLKYIDPDGAKIYFAPGSSDKFKAQFAATVQFMNSRGTSGHLAKLHASDKVYYIREGDRENKFSPKESSIVWDPNNILETDTGIWMSPATTLAHEADHAQRYDSAIRSKAGVAQLSADKLPNSDNIYGTKEERRVITGTEQEAARKHGEIKEGQVTRENHKIMERRIQTNNASPEDISKTVFERNNLL